ncbi:hypothetical protein KSP40_PGU022691 [Platanthera guangdongensis]|uniref:Uncharacterized protein n=1 Tax=Platanthera guangdongensis TaxID=2320717 RepID=A0ABR2LEN9_9ASPA
MPLASGIHLLHSPISLRRRPLFSVPFPPACCRSSFVRCCLPSSAGIEGRTVGGEFSGTSIAFHPGQKRKAYPFDEVEPRWQRYWEENATFRTPDEILKQDMRVKKASILYSTTTDRKRALHRALPPVPDSAVRL